MIKANKKNNNFIIKRILSALPALIFMVIIFIYSSKTADQSSASSDPIAETALSIYESAAGRYPEHIRPEKLDFFSRLVRKTAHVCEYALLAVLVSLHLYVSGFKRKKMVFISIAFCAFYASTDEFHQHFIEGRSCQFSDVCIDTAGAVIGTLAFLVLLTVIRNINAHNKNDLLSKSI